MIIFPNAKINLGLDIVGKRADGYHNIETVFYPVPIRDALEIVGAGSDSFRQTGIPLDIPPEKNIVLKALRALREHADVPPLEIHLLKKIPFGAGLGGGSSDAASMLKLARDFCNLDMGDTMLERMASAIGADCPFFIRNTPMFATGIGDRFEPVKLSLKGYWLCLVKPGISVSTAEAYARTTPCQPEMPLKDIIHLPPENWKDTMKNDFEPSVFARFPEIGEIKQALYKAGAAYAAMSGSGSSVFGLFREAPRLPEKFPGCFVWEGELG